MIKPSDRSINLLWCVKNLCGISREIMFSQKSIKPLSGLIMTRSRKKAADMKKPSKKRASDESDKSEKEKRNVYSHQRRM